MWFAEGIINGKSFKKLLFKAPQNGKKQKQENIPFIIGRREGDLIYSADRRVSRIHAHIFIKIDKTHQSRPKLWITDLSKFGTMINTVKIDKNKPHELHENDRVCVGITSSTFCIKWMDFNVLFSRISAQQKKSMKLVIQSMGGTISPNSSWSDDVTHLFVPNNNLPITAKVLSAIINDKDIVTMEWLKHIFNHKTIPSNKIF